MRRAKQQLEERAKKRAESEQAEYERKCKAREKQNAPKGRKPKPPKDTPKESEQINMTDADSRLMRKNNKSEYTQSYNAQAAVDADGSQLILHNHVTTCSTDNHELLPAVIGVIDAVEYPTSVLADSGYINREHLEKIEKLCVEPFVPPRRNEVRTYDFRPPKQKDEKKIVDEYLLKMRDKLDSDAGKQQYAFRKQTVEPVFGIIKQVLGFRQFLLRGLEKVSGEWTLVCLAYNMKRLFALKYA